MPKQINKLFIFVTIINNKKERIIKKLTFLVCLYLAGPATFLTPHSVLGIISSSKNSLFIFFGGGGNYISYYYLIIIGILTLKRPTIATTNHFSALAQTFPSQ